MLFIGCNSDDDSGSSSFNGSYESIRNLVGQQALDSLENGGMVIYTGDTPPDLMGTYFVSPMKILQSILPTDYPGMTYGYSYETFANQDNENLTIDISGVTTGPNGVVELSDGSGSFISGSGNNFTIAWVGQASIGSGTSDVVAIVSGTKQTNGIVNYTAGSFMVDNNGFPQFMANNHWRIIYDSDGFSEKQ